MLTPNVFSSSESEKLKSLLRNPKKDFQEITLLLEKKVEERIEKIKESEEKYRDLFHNSPLGIFLFDEKGNLIEGNTSASNAFSGYPSSFSYGKNFTDIIDLFKNSDELLQIFMKRSKDRTEGEKLKPVDVRLVRQDGQMRWLNWQSSTIHLKDKVLIQAIVQDITDRITAEEALKESEEKYRMLFDGANDAIFLINSYKFMECNKMTLEIFGCKNENDIIGFYPWEFSPPNQPNGANSKERAIELMDKTLKGPSLRFYWKHNKKDNTLFDAEVSLNRVLIKSEYWIQAIVRDITEQINAQQELIKLNQIKTELLRRTSHELKTPLVSIKGFSDLLLELHKDKLNDYVIGTLNRIREGCVRLDNLINDILKTAELESGKMQLKKSEGDLILLIKHCINELSGLSKLRNHSIDLKIHDTLVFYFEKEKIHQVLSNILSNAIKFTPPFGRIEIQSKIKDEFVIISIKDDGIGFTEEEKGQIFKQFGKIERFGQGLDVISEGSGLGLYISKKIIKLHDGEIWMESEGRSKGSNFYFSLPLIKE
ncbi:MAG: PAS domain S-box protein [Promethearchaeota archaeon]